MDKNQTNKKFWSFVNAVNDTPAELILYGEISPISWWGDEVTPGQFNDDLHALGDVKEIIVRINSGGGDVFAANAIYTRLKDHKAKITVKVDGWAASAATIIAMAGDTIQIPANGVFMIHDPKMCALGYFGAEEFIKMSEELMVIKQSIINGYALKTGKNQEEISRLMSAATWYDGKQAVESGFCDELMFGEVQTEVENASRVVVNSVAFNLEHYTSIPPLLLNSRNTQDGGLPYEKKQTQKGEEQSMEIKTVDELKAAYPALTAQVAQQAANDERKRIRDIEGIAIAGFEGIIAKAKFEIPTMSAADVAMNIVAEQKKQGEKYLAGVTADVKDSGTKGVTPDAHEGGIKPEINPYTAAIDSIFPISK